MSSNHVINLESGFVELSDDINVFLPNKGPQSCEKLFKGSKENEERKEIRTEHFDGTSKCIGRLAMKYQVSEGTKDFVGSATLVWVGKAPWRKFFLITCAHNVLREGWKQKKLILEQPTRVTFYRGLDKKEYLSRHEVTQVFVPDRYKKTLVQSGNTAACLNTGYDYAICILKSENCLTQLELPNLLSFDNEMKDDDEITITGYPGEYNTQWTDSGIAKTVKKTKHNGAVVIYDTVDTTPGQSGSPILSNGKLVGIHIGELGNCNIATLITAQVKDWINFRLWDFLKAKPCKFDERLEQCLRAESPDCSDEKEPFYGQSSASICFLGKTGSGKSTLLNALAPGANAAVGRSNFSVTEEVTKYTKQWFDKDGVGHFIDVPGFGDSGNEDEWKNRDEQFSKDIHDYLKFCDQISCFVIVLSGRADKTCKQMIKFYSNLLQLNDDQWRYVVFVKTHVDYTFEIKVSGGVIFWEEDLKKQEVELQEVIKKQFKVNDPQVVCIGNLWNKNGELYEPDNEVRNVIICKLIDIKEKALGNAKLGGMSMEKIQLAMLPEQFNKWQAGVAEIKRSLTRKVTHIMGRDNLMEIMLSLVGDFEDKRVFLNAYGEAMAKVTTAIDLTLNEILIQWADFLGTSTGKKLNISKDLFLSVVKNISRLLDSIHFRGAVKQEEVENMVRSMEPRSKIIVIKVKGYFDRITSQIIDRNEF